MRSFIMAGVVLCCQCVCVCVYLRNYKWPLLKCRILQCLTAEPILPLFVCQMKKMKTMDLPRRKVMFLAGWSSVWSVSVSLELWQRTYRKQRLKPEGARYVKSTEKADPFHQHKDYRSSKRFELWAPDRFLNPAQNFLVQRGCVQSEYKLIFSLFLINNLHESHDTGRVYINSATGIPCF